MIKNCQQCNQPFTPNHIQIYCKECGLQKRKESKKKYASIPENKLKKIIANRLYRQDNREKIREYMETRKNLQSVKDYHSKYQREYRKKYPEIHNAHARAHIRKLIGSECRLCESKENLHFHHTNYEKDEGITLCALCHNYLHHNRVRWGVSADTIEELAQRNEEVKQLALEQLKILNGKVE